MVERTGLERAVADEPPQLRSSFAADSMAFHCTAYLTALVGALLYAALHFWLSEEAPVRNVEGFTAPGFKKVAEAFRLLLLSGEETGGSFAVSYKGDVIVDLWGGYADLDAWRPWRKDTITNAFLTTYALGVSCILLLADRQQIDLDKPVSHYWPEFAARGKQEVTVAQLLKRELLIASLKEPLRLSQLDSTIKVSTNSSRSSGQSREALATVLANQWVTNASLAATASGWQHQSELSELYMDQLVRRVDAKGRGLAEFARDEITAPHELSCYIGLPSDVFCKASRLSQRSWPARLLHLFFSPSELLQCVLSAKGAPTYDLATLMRLNDPDVQRKPIFSTSSYATARSLVHLYELLTRTGRGTKASVLSPGATKLLLSQVTNTSASTTLSWLRRLLEDRTRTAAVGGVLLQNAGTTKLGFGNAGIGGQYVFVDAENDLVMAYLTNHLGISSASVDPRFATVQKALYNCLPRS